MAIIIETCPECGHDLTDLILATHPPIPQKKCFGCGWSWTGEREEVVRVPFSGANGRSYLNCIDDAITDKEIQEHLSTTINTMVTNYASKYME